MKYYTIEPPTELADYIQYFWVLEGSASINNPFSHRALADCCPELIFYYNGFFNILTDTSGPLGTFASGVYGQSKQFKKLKATTSFGIFGVYLYPYAVPSLFSLPAHQLSGQSADLISLCGKDGIALEEKVILASNNYQRVKLVSDFIRKRLYKSNPNNPGILHCIKHLTHSKYPASITSLANDCNLSRRQFERIFKWYSGFSPKNYINLVRFNAVIKSKKPAAFSLTQTALDFGYFDQSHFIHDFKTFSGYTPKEYFKQKIAEDEYRASVEFKL